MKIKKKVFWFDVETTGLDHLKNGIIQLSYIIEIDGKIEKKRNFFVRPPKFTIIDNQALSVTNTKPEDLQNYMPFEIVFNNLISDLDLYVDKFETTDKFYMAGYNVTFDERFLRRFFKINNHKYFGSYFNNKKIDVFGFVDVCIYCDIIPNIKSRKLSELCDLFSIPLNAHDSSSDIQATRDLFYLLKNYIR